ncbi:MAG: deoxyribodipyrimidine photo-lyase [Pseudomonadota bacterium]
MSTAPILLWLRRDLRLADHAALSAAVATGRPVIPVFIHDDILEAYGACPKWRMGLAIAHFAKVLEGVGSRLILRRGNALACLQALIEETGADTVYWSRAYDPDAIARDTSIKARLKEAGHEAASFEGAVLFEPWTVTNKSGGFFKVFSPMWKSVRDREVDACLPAPSSLPAPEAWPRSDDLEDWAMGAGMNRGAAIVGQFVKVGEQAAADRLALFLNERVADYARARDMMALEGTSGLSENLTYGEISPRQCWHAGWEAFHKGAAGAETFLKELVWREFAYQLVFHTPHILTGNWKPEWDAFAWSEDDSKPEVLAWKQGRTGIQLVDAAMREMYVTGYMHNRGRMIVASYLTKHLMTHWKIGQAWFDECLIDWDPASNAMGWQWAAGSGPDASPYFRIFNPDTQAEKFDGNRAYRARYLAELFANHEERAELFYKAIPRSWDLSKGDSYPKPVVGLQEGRERALEAYQNR